MLRLRPSEITLTPADVEETRRRIARKASPALTTKAPRPPIYRRHGPQVRRGPNRSRDDAISPLGNIPVLKPHQAMHSSADADDDDQPHHLAQSLTYKSIQLPFRTVPRAGTEALSTSEIYHSTVSSFGQRTSNTDDPIEINAPFHLESSIDGFVDAARSVSTTARNDSEQQVEENREAGSPSEHMPTLLLQGYFVSPERYRFREYQAVPQTEPRRRSSRFTPRIRTLSSSSDPTTLLPSPADHRNLPAPAVDDFWTGPSTETAVQTQAEVPEVGQSEGTRPRSSFDERMRRAHMRLESIQGRYRDFFGRARISQPGHDASTTRNDADRYTSQRISEASSNSSLPYSYYELPTSRHSSSNRSFSGEQLSQSQVDGAAPSRQVNRGAYHSIRPSQDHVANSDNLRPMPTRVSSFSSPNLTMTLGQHGLSPLPASPYTRTQSTSSIQRPSLSLVTQDDFADEGRDATSAALRGLPSPLDLFQERAVMHLAQLSETLPSGPPQPAPNAASVFQYQIEELDATEPRRRRTPGSSSMRQESGNSAYYRMTAVNRRRTHMQWSERSQSLQPRAGPGAGLRPSRRAVPARPGQRSSENVPVIAAAAQMTQQIPRATQSQAQSVSFSQIPPMRSLQGVNMRGGDIASSPGPSRFSIAHTSRPRDLSSRYQRVSPYQPSTLRSIRDHDYSDYTHFSDPISPNPHRRYETDTEPRRRPISQHGEVSRFYHERQQHSSVYHGALPQPDRRFTNNRRPPIPTRVTSRHISAQQLNQENSGDAHEALMREEMATAGMRYAEDGAGLNVMDETPPPLGRFERHMMDSTP